jgi:hypothetical protein
MIIGPQIEIEFFFHLLAYKIIWEYVDYKQTIFKS